MFSMCRSCAVNVCKLKDEKCYLCSKKSHIVKACLSKRLDNQTFQAKVVGREELSNEEPTQEELELYRVYAKSEVKNYLTTAQIGNEKIVMENDTRTAVFIIPEELCRTKLIHFPAVKSKIVLKMCADKRL